MRPEAFGFAKLILFGEHAVVYGHPALAVATDQRTTASATPALGPTRLSRADGVPIDDDRVHELGRRLLPAVGWSVELTSDIPIGSGMGSSSALCVALARLGADLVGQPVDNAIICARATDGERLFHGNPSGVDTTLATWGGAIRFRKGPPPEVIRVDPPRQTLVVLHSGRSGDTAEQVARVAAQRPGIDPVLEQIGAMADRGLAAFDDPVRLGSLFDENHDLLRAIGVSTPELDALCALARAHGATGAKLSGAGGGGIAIAVAPDPDPVLTAAARAGYDASIAHLGAPR